MFNAGGNRAQCAVGKGAAHVQVECQLIELDASAGAAERAGVGDDVGNRCADFIEYERRRTRDRVDRRIRIALRP